MKKSLIPILLVLVLGLCLISACNRHPGTTEESTEPSGTSSIPNRPLLKPLGKNQREDFGAE
ncbi:MAG: hypothetical protein JW817_00840 [Clostridiales bacterium]|nr:hypothetical protein [Clostridiales bacterium]